MSIMELGAIGEFVGSIAVVVTLAYLAIQIRTNTDTVRETNSRVHTDRMIDHSRLIAANRELTDIFRRGSADISQLDDLERWQFGTYLYSLFLDYQSEYHTNKRMRLDDYHWAFQRKNLVRYLSRPGIRDWWDKVDMLDEEFFDYANTLLDRKDVDRALA